MIRQLHSSIKTILVCSLFLMACSKSENVPEAPTPTTDVSPLVVVKSAFKMSTNVTFVTILKDDKGKSLYYFGPDAKGVSVPLSGVWPILALNTVALTQ